jgi:hypothetical protein
LSHASSIATKNRSISPSVTIHRHPTRHGQAAIMYSNTAVRPSNPLGPSCSMRTDEQPINMVTALQSLCRTADRPKYRLPLPCPRYLKPWNKQPLFESLTKRVPSSRESIEYRLPMAVPRSSLPICIWPWWWPISFASLLDHRQDRECNKTGANRLIWESLSIDVAGDAGK